MKYIALLDYEQLDHSIFMKSFAESMGMQNGCEALILHGDSPYTERLIQTGMMREEAVLRSTREINRKIVTLLAHFGIAATGMSGYHKSMLTVCQGRLVLQDSVMADRPVNTHLVLSNLVWNEDRSIVQPWPVIKMACFLVEYFSADSMVFFSRKAYELAGNCYQGKAYLCTPGEFGKLPEISVFSKKPVRS